VPTLSTGTLVATVGTNTYLMFADSFVANHGWVVSDVDQADTDADDWTPMVSLAYLLDGAGFIESGSAYITVSKGFRSGGLSEAPSADLEEYEPEEVISTEAGLKFDALDSRLRMNLAVFDLQYEDRQLTTIAVSPQGRIAGATINAKDSWVRGVELESTFLPVENLELTFTGSWYDNDIEEYEDIQLSLTSATTLDPGCAFTLVPGLQSCVIDRSDEDLPRLPEKTLLLAAQYYFQTGIGTIIPRIQYSKKYAVDGCFDRFSCISGDFLHDLEDLSARLTWVSTEGDWQISAYGTNLQDEEQIIGGQPLYDTWGFGGVTYAPPRMYGAEFTYNW
jgi:iron complex outermembrane recepter protein